ncbi:N5-glutamine methyltransferase family protein [Brockia lithotrophica]|uniref:peptide chain release factor N(5)-glutamine methyltransferase n=1 Tax=Brockia lithotrophica TaxID=933949 RepID=A0A660KV82_9BACL|nr:HemK/PrmC family methyltransferase [Brockia lithotrophica]RKQ83858.1 [protein release factor]-glutamine N5-methyltransferase [Brockia lithotrophica]
MYGGREDGRAPTLSFRKAYEALREGLVRAGKGDSEAEAEARFYLQWLYGLSALAFLEAMRGGEPRVPEPLISAFLRARGWGIPFAYLVGEAEFFGLRLTVTPDVLVPRGDSERLVEAVLALTQDDLEKPRHILDLGTGSGALGLALLSRRPRWTADLLDVSYTALRLAAHNARRLGLAGRVRILWGDAFAPSALPEGLAAAYDGIVANPPYVATEEIPALAPEVRWEPILALDGGADGLRPYPRIAALAEMLLRPGGFLAVEVGGGPERVARVRGMVSPRMFEFAGEVVDYGRRLRGLLWKRK